jgi:tetratricopeptide (TPR) repeat protein
MIDYNKKIVRGRLTMNTRFQSAKEIYIIWLSLLVLFLITLSPFPTSASETCYMNTPSGFQRMGGASRIGPYSSRAQCGGVNSQFFNGAGICSCTSTAPAYKQQQPSIDYGEQQRRQQEEQRRREEAERKRRMQEQAEEEARQREDARKKQFEQDKQNALKLLKSGSKQIGLKGVSGGEIKLKGTGQTGLKLKEPLFSKGTQESAPVDLQFMEEDAPLVVDPEDLKATSGGASAIDKDLPVDVKVDALYRRAVNSFGSGDYDTSIKYYIEALKLKPADRNIQIALSEVMWAKDKKEGNIKKNLKMTFLLDALEYGNGNLDKSIGNVLKIAEDRYQAGDNEGLTASIDALEIIVNLKKENMDEWMRENDKWLLYNKDIGDVLEKKYPKRTWPGPKNPDRH